MSLKKITLLLCLFVCASVCSADWVFVTKVDDGTVVRVQTNSIKKKGALKKVWVDLSFPAARKTSDIPPVSYDQEIMLQYVDCKKGTSTSVQAIYYLDKKMVTRTKSSLSEKEMNENVPGSLGDLLVPFVCKQKRAK